MNHTTTYPPQSPRPANGGYRYFFNGQEADNEILGEGALHAFEFRMHDTRIGRFGSIPKVCNFRQIGYICKTKKIIGHQ